MRTSITVILLFLISLSCREKETVLPLAAPVESVQNLPVSYQAIKEGSAVAGRIKHQSHNGKISTEWRYNPSGQLVEMRMYHLSGEVTHADQYRYDKAGHLRFVQHFDNNCMLSSHSGCGGPVTWTSYDELETDAAGRITQSRTYLKINGDWELRSTSTYAYDSQGQLTRVQRFDKQNVLTNTLTYSWDGRGNVVALREQNVIASADLADRTFRYEYDTGLNPYRNTVYYTSAFFLSRHVPLSPGTTYEYRPDNQPARIRENGITTELAYY